MHEKVNNFSISYQHIINCNLSWTRQQEFQIHLIRETVSLDRHILAVRNCSDFGVLVRFYHHFKVSLSS